MKAICNLVISSFILSTLFALLLGVSSRAWAISQTFCGGRIIVESTEPVNLSDTETVLVCGDPKVNAWSNVPLRQAAYFMRTFLGDRGYPSSTTSIQNDHLHVKAGPLALVRKVILESTNTPPGTADPAKQLDVSRYWPILGKPMTPKELDELEKWVKARLGRLGYACVRTEVAANPDTGIVRVSLSNAKVFEMPAVKADYVPGTNGRFQERYYAFREGEAYNSLELELSARRMISDEVVVNTYFVTECASDGQSLTVEQKIVPGDPRLVTVGLGFDTEEYVIAEASWKHKRLGPSASGFTAIARTSYRNQLASLLFDWHYAPIVTRHFLRSSLTYERTYERRQDTRTIEARVGPAWAGDLPNIYYDYWIGGRFEHTETIRGTGPATSDIFLLESEVNLMTHDFEYFLADPRTGYSLGVNLQRAKKGVGSNISASRYLINGHALWSAFSLDPPVWILGLRTELASTVIDPDTQLADVPLTFRNFLGGSRDLRGFGRRAVPPRDEGAFTTAYIGAETRVREVLPFNLQPIVFADFGKIGGNDMTLDKELYWSPGVGLHWQSPVGVLRSTVAHGFIEGPRRDELSSLSRLQFYLSFGEQF